MIVSYFGAVLILWFRTSRLIPRQVDWFPLILLNEATLNINLKSLDLKRLIETGLGSRTYFDGVLNVDVVTTKATLARFERKTD